MLWSAWLSWLLASGLLVSGCRPSVTPHPLQPTALGYRLDDPTVPSAPFAGVQWKALLLAGDHTLGVFDRAMETLARLFQQRRITVVRRFSADPTQVSDTVRLATVDELRRAVPLMRARPGEGCIVYATSHGTTEGLRLTRDLSSGYRLRPAVLRSLVHEACGDAPTVLVLSGCYSGTYVREGIIGPQVIVLTAAAAHRQSFGCRAGETYTYYDRCFVREFPQARTWQELYHAVCACIDVAERSLSEPASAPQAFFGRLMKDVPIPQP